jgi:hypothetical protein
VALPGTTLHHFTGQLVEGWWRQRRRDVRLLRRVWSRENGLLMHMRHKIYDEPSSPAGRTYRVRQKEEIPSSLKNANDCPYHGRDVSHAPHAASRHHYFFGDRPRFRWGMIEFLGQRLTLTLLLLTCSLSPHVPIASSQLTRVHHTSKRRTADARCRFI